MAISNIVFTQHAQEMLIQRDIDRKWVKATIADPYAIERDPTYPGVLRAFLPIAERGGRCLRVVYVSEGGGVRILTAFFDRRRQR